MNRSLFLCSTAYAAASMLMGGMVNFYPDPEPAPPAAEPVIPEAAPTLLDQAKIEEPPKEGDPPKEEPAAGDPPKEEPPKEGDPPKEEPPKVPEAYELKAPDDAALDPKAVELATPIFKELGLNNDQAQKVVDLYAKDIMPAVAQQVQAQTLELLGIADIGNWTDMVKADKEIGGAKLTETMALAAAGRDQFATPELKALLETTRLGNHPEVIRFFAKVGKTIGEGEVIPAGGAGTGQRDLAQGLYGQEFQPKS